PVARMANLVVQSKHTLSAAKLKEALHAEVRRQQKPFGLLIKDVTVGNTDTSGYAYQAFKGQPRLVYKVDAKTGEETLVRGVEIVGTPLTSINKITATGAELGACQLEREVVEQARARPVLVASTLRDHHGGILAFDGPRSLPVPIEGSSQEVIVPLATPNDAGSYLADLVGVVEGQLCF